MAVEIPSDPPVGGSLRSRLLEGSAAAVHLALQASDTAVQRVDARAQAALVRLGTSQSAASRISGALG